MPHPLFTPCVTVYVWLQRGFYRERVGHAALKVTDGDGHYCYLSYWPEHAPSGPGPNSLRHLAEQLGGGVWAGALAKVMTADPRDPKGTPSFDGDADHEGTKPDYRARFLAGFNFPTMLQRAMAYRSSTDKYSLWSSNCSRTVATVLAAGNPALDPPTGGITGLVTPGDIMAYCQKMAAQIGSPNAVQTNNENQWI